MIKNLLNVLKKTSMISWVTDDDIPTMFNIQIKNTNSNIIIKGDVETEFKLLHNYKIEINKDELIKFNKSIDNVLTLSYKNNFKKLILNC
ncbi:hypothetical protein [Clostridium botulinum]|uniref:hypothetical protein n=1 Tax=Clostridium botulinum TaxID=1491 RepID=UPI001C9B6900|nr:hypothetical protein [Clostridium botulinum]MBY6842864.1 hypothetical protein [Clostridium botulinum]